MQFANSVCNLQTGVFNRKRIGLPITLPQTLAEDDSIELTTALGLFDDKTCTYYNGTKLRRTARLNIIDSGAGDSCLHPLYPYIVPNSKV